MGYLPVDSHPSTHVESTQRGYVDNLHSETLHGSNETHITAQSRLNEVRCVVFVSTLFDNEIAIVNRTAPVGL